MEKKTKIILVVLIALIVCGLAIALLASPSSMTSSGNTTITDMANRTVTIPSSIDRIVATSPPMTTIMYMLVPDKLVGVNFQWTDEELKYVPDQYKDKFPVIGGWFGSQDGNYEEFIASEPNFVVESIDEGMGVDLSTVEERQEKFGSIPVVAVTDNTNVTKVGSTIEFMGKILQAEDKAKELIDFNEKNGFVQIKKVLLILMISICQKSMMLHQQFQILKGNPFITLQAKMDYLPMLVDLHTVS